MRFVPSPYALERTTHAGHRSADAVTVVAATDHVSRHDKQGRIRVLAVDVAERHKGLLDRLAQRLGPGDLA
jgi:hypothetical protein